MKNWKFLLLLSIGSLSLICISCEKEEEIEFPITLYGSEVVKVSNIRMFTNKEEIYDTDKIMQFAYSSNVVLPGIPDNMDIKNSLTPICFCSEDSVRFKDDPGNRFGCFNAACKRMANSFYFLLVQVFYLKVMLIRYVFE